MTRIFTIISILAFQMAFSQNPLLKVYVDKKELNPSANPVSAFVKSKGKYYSILQSKNGLIKLPEEIEFHKIEGLRFIVKNDTITFPVEKILEDLKMHPEKNMVDELYAIFREVSKWELRVNKFKYSEKEQMLASGKLPQPNKDSTDSYKLYSLRTTNLKYYIVKEK